MNLDERLATAYRARKWIVVFEVAVAATDMVEQLRTWGAAEIMVVAGARGVGSVPEDVPVFYTRSGGSTVMQGIRAFRASHELPSPQLRSAVAAFDPEGEARVVGTQFLRAGAAVGRPVYGGRTAQWARLEDKTIIDDLWDRCGVAREPAVVVDVADAPAAAADLAGSRGTVWVADNTEGWHGGAEYTRWVPDRAAVAAAVRWFAARSERVRVMPFMDGIPCSIHGYVASDGVAVFRPVEMVILRRSDRPAFVYAGTATFWDPPIGIRREMRAAAAAVGAEVAAALGYRGGFSIDGVCTGSGFRPTELNPRLSPGLEMQARTAGVPLNLATAAYLAGDLELPAPWLEANILPLADARRSGGMGLPITDEVAPAAVGVVFTDGRAEPVPVPGSDATLEIGPAIAGSYLRMKLDPERVAPGPSVAPLAVAAVKLAADRWGVDVPDMQPSPDRC